MITGILAAAPVICQAQQSTASWTGFYLGLEAGYQALGNDSIKTTATNIYFFDRNADIIGDQLVNGLNQSRSSSPGGVFGGVNFSYLYQASRSFIIGGKVSLDGGGSFNNKKEFTINASTDIPQDDSELHAAYEKYIDFSGSAQLKAGFLLKPDWLLYGSGGLMFGLATLKQTFTLDNVGDRTIFPGSTDKAKTSRMKLGYVVGLGTAWQFKPRWLLNVAYQYYSLGKITNHATITKRSSIPAADPDLIITTSSKTRFSGNMIKLGVSYKL